MMDSSEREKRWKEAWEKSRVGKCPAQIITHVWGLDCYCDLEQGHDGPHQDTGTAQLEGGKYRILWYDRDKMEWDDDLNEYVGETP